MSPRSSAHRSLGGPVLWVLALGAVQAASPLSLQWIEPATFHAMYTSTAGAGGTLINSIGSRPHPL